VTMADTAKKHAEELGYDTFVASHNDDANTQSNLIETAISKGRWRSFWTTPGQMPRSSRSRRPRQQASDLPGGREINSTGDAVSQIVSNNFQGATLGASSSSRCWERRATTSN